ncbi:hypothetical protein MMC32_001847 [Xylographa parallela]|nr:hypothetical protein [Xylographa parallela]
MDAAAGAVAFASIAIQLGQSFVALYQYWESIKEAPADISTVVQDLKLLAAILRQIESDEQKYGQAPEVTDVLKSCMAKVDTLRNLVEELEPGFASKHRLQRKWSALKAVLKNDKVEKFRRSLEETKTTMLLARSLSQERIQLMRFQSSEEQLSSIVSTLGSLQVQQCSRTVTTTSAEDCDGGEQWATLRSEIKRMASEMSNPLYRAGFEHAMDYSLRQMLNSNSAVKNDSRFDGEREKANERTAHHESPRIRHRKNRQWLSGYAYSNENVFGTVAVRSSTFLKQSINDADDSWENPQVYEHKMSICIEPAWWLIMIGFNRGLQVAFSQATDQSFKIALNPFRLVPDDALVFEFCRTGNIVGVRKLLIRGEASARDTNSMGDTPLHMAAAGCNVELARLLIDAGAANSRGGHDEPWTPLELVARSYDYVHYQQKIDTLRLLSDKLDLIGVDDSFFIHGLLHSMTAIHLDPRDNGQITEWAVGYYFSELISNTKYLLDYFDLFHPSVQKALVGTILTLPDFESYTSTICCVAQNARAASIRILLNIGFNPHFVVDRIEGRETLTSLAMSSSGAFDVWRTELKTLGTNYEDFVQEEMKLGVLSEMGWTIKSLFSLFDKEVVLPDFRWFVGFVCSTCGVDNKLFEPAWRIELDKIRRDEDVDNSVQKVSKRIEDIVVWQDVPYEFLCSRCLEEFVKNDYKPFPLCPRCGKENTPRRAWCVNCKVQLPVEDDEDDGSSPFKLF